MDDACPRGESLRYITTWQHPDYREEVGTKRDISLASGGHKQHHPVKGKEEKHLGELFHGHCWKRHPKELVLKGALGVVAWGKSCE